MISMELDGLKGALEDSESDLHYLTITSTVSAGSKGKREPIEIKGLLPREVSIAVSSDWGAPLDEGVGGSLAKAASLFGVSFKAKVKTAQIWQGTSPLEIDFSFPLIAEKDAQEDVIEKVKRILKMPLPSTVDGKDISRFIPPGPSFLGYLASQKVFDDPPGNGRNPSAVSGAVDAVRSSLNENYKKVADATGKEEEQVTISFGKFLTFQNVVILSSNVRLHTQQLHHTGVPIKAEVDLRFRMYTVPHKGEIDQIFQGSENKNRPLDLSKLRKQAEKSANSAIKSKLRGLF